MDFTQFALLGLLLAGITELITRLRAKDYWVAVTILTCAVVGGLAGYFKLFGAPNLEVGVLVGFATSGALKAASILGQKSTPAPSGILTRAKQKVLD